MTVTCRALRNAIRSAPAHHVSALLAILAPIEDAIHSFVQRTWAADVRRSADRLTCCITMTPDEARKFSDLLRRSAAQVNQLAKEKTDAD